MKPIAEIIANDGEAFDVEWDAFRRDELQPGTKLYAECPTRIAELEKQLSKTKTKLRKSQLEIYDKRLEIEELNNRVQIAQHRLTMGVRVFARGGVYSKTTKWANATLIIDEAQGDA